MPLRIFNTLTRKVETFTPLNEGNVSLFVCGPTVYGLSHIGHAKTYTQFDFISRYLKRFYNVRYLMNITDVDDKIISKSQTTGVPALEIAREFEMKFFSDMDWLHNTSVTDVARAHDYIEHIVSQVERLRDMGAAYQLEDGWYFDLSVLPAYGKLSGRAVVQEGDSVSRIDENKNKRNVGDFALWKTAKAGEPFWESSLGDGRPGWHIEDTAITEAVFGPQYDIHGGAIDLIFPHHEAEIAQMETISGQTPLAKYWVHTGLLNVDGEKMAKSVGNFITISSLKTDWDYRTLRYLFLSQHYRSSTDFSFKLLNSAALSRQRVENFYLHATAVEDTADIIMLVNEARDKFYRKLDEDFNTPEALAAVFDLIKKVNRTGSVYGETVKAFLEEINSLFDAFHFEDSSSVNVDDDVDSMLALRNELRANKRFAEADEIREALKKKGYLIEDSPSGSFLKRLS